MRMHNLGCSLGAVEKDEFAAAGEVEGREQTSAGTPSTRTITAACVHPPSDLPAPIKLFPFAARRDLRELEPDPGRQRELREPRPGWRAGRAPPRHATAQNQRQPAADLMLEGRRRHLERVAHRRACARFMPASPQCVFPLPPFKETGRESRVRVPIPPRAR